MLLLLGGGLYAAFKLSPWPAALLIRHAFDRGAAAADAALARHMPPGIEVRLDIRYGPGRDERLDLYRPPGHAEALPAIVWIHGGGFISGTHRQVGNYLRILAGHGYAAVSVGYSIAPGAMYPTPLRQANAALSYLRAHAAELGIDAERIILAGDSAGAQIAAQLATVITAPDYAHSLGVTPAIAASALRGAILHCGVYDATEIHLDGAFGGFMRTVLWSYFGRRDVAGDARLAEFSVARHVTASFPPTFISAGNADPLLPHSRALAVALMRQGVAVDTLFFPPDQDPPLGHEYQFDLDGRAGRIALERSMAFAAARLR